MDSEFRSLRLSFRAVIEGALLALALMLFLSTSVGNLFVASDHGELNALPLSLWLSMILVWIFSVLCGSVLAASVSRSREVKDGILHGVMVWAISYLLLSAVIAARALGYEPLLELEEVSRFLVAGDILGELTALLAGILGGILGAYWERPRFSREPRPANPASSFSGAIVSSP